MANQLSQKAYTVTTNILIIGQENILNNSLTNCLETINSDYKCINRDYLPSLFEIKQLSADFIIFNLYELCTELIPQYQNIINNISLPVVALTDQSNQELITQELKCDEVIVIDNNQEKNLINKIKNYFAPEELDDTNTTNQRVFSRLSKINENTQHITRSFNFSEEEYPVFHYDSVQSNIASSLKYRFKNNLPSSFCELLKLSVSQQALLFFDVNNTDSNTKVLLIGYLQGVINSLVQEQKEILYSPVQLVNYLQEQACIYQEINELSLSVWYGLIDMSSHKVEYYASSNIQPICLHDNTQRSEINILPAPEYNKPQAVTLQPNTRILLTTPSVCAKNEHQEIIASLFSDISAKNSKINNIPEQLVNELLKNNIDLIRTTGLAEGSLFYICELPPTEQLVLNITPEQANSDINELTNKLTEQVINSIQLSPENNPVEIKLSINKLIANSLELIQQANNINNALNQSNEDAQITLSYWKTQYNLDLSCRLSNNSMSWAFRNTEEEFVQISGINPELHLYFDNIECSHDQYEISMSKRI